MEGVGLVVPDRAAVVEHLARRGLRKADHHVQQLRLAGRRRADDRGARARLDGERDVLEHLALAIGQGQALHLDRAGQRDVDIAARRRRRGVQHHGDAEVGRLGLADRVGGEADDEDREDQDHHIGVEGHVLADRHLAGDHQPAPQKQDGQGGDVGQEAEDRHHRGEGGQDLHADGPRVLGSGGEAVQFARRGVDQPDQSRADDVLVQHAVHAVDDALDLAEQLAHPGHEHEEAQGHQGEHRQHRQGQLPVHREEQDAGADDLEDRGDQGRGGLGHEALDGGDVGREVGQQLGRRLGLDLGVGLLRDLVGELRAQVAGHALGRDGLDHVLQVAEDEGSDRDRGQGDQFAGQVELAGVEGVDPLGHDPGHQQADRAAGHGEHGHQR